jgi:hypothetical protein
MRIYQTDSGGTTHSLVNTYGALTVPLADLDVGSYYVGTVTVGGTESPYSNIVLWSNPT